MPPVIMVAQPESSIVVMTNDRIFFITPLSSYLLGGFALCREHACLLHRFRDDPAIGATNNNSVPVLIFIEQSLS